MKETLKRNPEESYKEYLTRVAAYIALLKKQGLLNEADEASNIARSKLLLRPNKVNGTPICPLALPLFFKTLNLIDLKNRLSI